ncbi:MAG: hypothetical protein MJZ46_08395 [Bacteroidales bacterium]|nr:hypothetical protein [Bacteroidales bacterium]
MRALKITDNQFDNQNNTKTKIYPQAPKGCVSLEEFSDRLEEAVLKKI